MTTNIKGYKIQSKYQYNYQQAGSDYVSLTNDEMFKKQVIHRFFFVKINILFLGFVSILNCLLGPEQVRQINSEIRRVRDDENDGRNGSYS